MIGQAPPELPSRPGVYWWIGSDGRILYVGKAKNLKARVGSYFTDTSHKARTLRAKAEAISWTVTANETQALLAEAAMIAREEPPYNVKLKQDHPYPYFLITPGPWPAARVARNKDLPGQYFGPYPNREDANAAWHAAQVLGVRTCSDKRMARAEKEKRGCHLLELGRCLGPCVNPDVGDQYAEAVKAVTQAASGKPEVAATAFETRMLQAAKAEKYEQAAVWRDRAGAVRRMARVGQTQVKGSVEVYSVLPGDVVDTVCWQSVQDGCVRGVATWTCPPGSAAMAVQAGITTRQVHPRGRVAVLGVQARDIEVAGVKCYTPRSGPVYDVALAGVETARGYAAMHTAAMTRGTDRGAAAMTSVAAAAGVSKALRIIGVDIAHHGGQWAAASAVVFEDAVPTLTRSWPVPQELAGNDVASIAYAVEKALELEEGPYPTDVIVVDGGEAQRDAGARTAAQKGSSAAVIGLAKRLEVVHTTHGEVILPREDPGLYLLQQVRDKAHYAAGAKMARTAKKTVSESALDQVRGVGEKRRRAVLNHFKSVKAVKEASVSELAAVPGVGVATAQRILDSLRDG